MSYTDNPVRDAEEYYSRHEHHPKIGYCIECSEPIYEPDALNYEVVYYNTPDGLVCEACKEIYLEHYKVKKEAV